MPKELIFLDTETTSKDNGRLVQLAYRTITDTEVTSCFYKPAEPITIEAMEIHGITNEAMDQYPEFDPETLNAFIKDKVIVAHNAKFDIDVLQREGVKTGEYIDTLKVARHLIPEAPHHRLQYLRYYLQLEVHNATAHDAKGDVNVLFNLFFKLVDLIGISKIEADLMPYEDIIKRVTEKMIELTNTPIRMDKMPFGKYKDKTFEQIMNIDRSYLRWLSGQELDEDLRYTLSCLANSKSNN